MPTPLGHAMTGLAVWAAFAPPRPTQEPAASRIGLAVFCASVACLPDIDFLLISEHGLQLSGDYHHGITHSIGFAIIVGSIIFLWATLRGMKRRFELSLLVTLSLTSHIMLDLLGIDTYSPNGVGLPALWPFSSAYYILPLLPPVSRTDPFTIASMMAMLIELSLCGTILAIAWWRMKQRKKEDHEN